MKLATYTSTGKKTADTDISLFDNAAHPSIVAQAVRVYLANQRSGTAKTKTRGEVDMTKAKWFKQKGTGRARHGAQSAPIFVGGGVTHGPSGNTNWKLSISKTMRRRALETALSMQAAQGRVIIVDGLDKTTGKTKDIVTLLTNMQIVNKAVLLITGTKNELLTRGVANLKNVLLCPADALTTYYVARAHTVLLTPEAVESLLARFATAQNQEDKPVKAAKKAAPKKSTRKTKAE